MDFIDFLTANVDTAVTVVVMGFWIYFERKRSASLDAFIQKENKMTITTLAKIVPILEGFEKKDHQMVKLLGEIERRISDKIDKIK